MRQLIRKQLDTSLIKLAKSYLSSRRVTFRYSGEQIIRETNKGCIQGSTCGPLLWNIMLDTIFEEVQQEGVHIQAFADDILLVATGKRGEQVEVRLNEALKAVVKWGDKNKLRFAPHKTQATLFTRKLRYYKPRIIMSEIEIPLLESIKILGLTIDRNLNYVEHISQAMNKAINLYKGVSRTARAHWGLNPEIVRIINISVVEPIVLYAANVWASKSHTVQIKKKLDHITRIFAILISKSHRTTSLTSSALLAGIIPLDLRSLERRKLYEVKKGKPLEQLPCRRLEEQLSPFDLPHPAHRLAIRHGTINDTEELEAISDEKPMMFTDGSKINGKVGAAVTIWVNGVEKKRRLLSLPGYCTVFQAELTGLQGAVQIMNIEEKYKKAKVCSDSKSALECLANPNSLHPLVCDIKTLIGNLRASGG